MTRLKTMKTAVLGILVAPWGVAADSSGAARPAEESVGPFPSWRHVQRDCGARGDGQADDGTAIQRGLDDLTKHADFCVLYLPAGRHRACPIGEGIADFRRTVAVLNKQQRSPNIVVESWMDQAESLSHDATETRVIEMHTIKPPDAETILDAARQTGAIVAAEKHRVVSGLGAAAAEVVTEGCPVPVRRVGIADLCAETGLYKDLLDPYGMSVDDILQAARRALAAKTRARQEYARRTS